MQAEEVWTWLLDFGGKWWSTFYVVDRERKAVANEWLLLAWPYFVEIFLAVQSTPYMAQHPYGILSIMVSHRNPRDGKSRNFDTLSIPDVRHHAIVANSVCCAQFYIVSLFDKYCTAQ